MGNCPEEITEIIELLIRKQREDFHFRCLYERYFGKLRLFFQRKKLSPEDALELTQEVFFSVYKNLEALRDHRDFEAWLFRIALNTFRNFWEKGKSLKRDAVVVGLESGDEDERDLSELLAAGTNSPLENLLEDEQQRLFAQALGELPEQMRRVFYLKIVHELTGAEIAAALGISVNTVKAHIFQARQKLRERLTQEVKK